MAGKGESGYSLDGAALRVFSNVVLELHDPALNDDGLFDRFIKRCESLVPHTSFWVMGGDMQDQAVTYVLGPWRDQAISVMPAFQRNAQDHPSFMAMCQGKARAADAVSDRVGRRRWRSTAIYDEVIRHTGGTDQISASRFLREGMSFSFVVNRDGWGFEDRDRSFLALLLPHVLQAWRTRSLSRQLLLTTQADGPQDSCFHVMADSWGNVVEATEQALLLLHMHFGTGLPTALPVLPELVRCWLRKRLLALKEGTEAVVLGELRLELLTKNGDPFQVRFSPGQRHGLHRLLFTRIRSRSDGASQTLTKLGLSLRQAEVLYWLSEGKTNEEIAGILEISLFTVKAHLRSIFNILAVENRQTAALLVWQTLQAGRSLT